jgi:uncharacterized RDD family membrane protein YckC
MSEVLATEPALPVPHFLVRAVARCIDLGVQVALMESAFQFAALLPKGGLITFGDQAMFALDLCIGLGAMVTYTALAEFLGGATLGKVLTGLRVVMHGRPVVAVTLRAAVIRSAAFLVDSLFFGLVAYSAMGRSRSGQRVGDEWAGTVVVWKGDAPAQPAHRGWPLGLAAAFALVVASYLIAP